MGLLDALAMVPLRVRQSKEALLEKWVLLVPKGESDVLEAMRIAYPRYSILSPAVGP